MEKNLLLLLKLLILWDQTNGANILFYHGVSSYSHRIAVWPLVEKLADIWHNVTFMSPFPPKVPNPKVNEFIPLGAEELYEEDVKAMMDRRLDGTYQDTWTELFPFSLLYCELILKHEGLQTWLSQQEPFDLIFIDTLFNDCAYGFVHKFKTPFIHISTSTVSMHEPDTAGHVPETSWIPDLQVHFPHDMNFLQRVSNTLRPLVWYFARCWWLFPKLETVLREHLNLTDLPSLCEMDKQASLVFINTHFSIEFARSLPPLYVPIGGLHIQEKLDEKLPKEMSEFLEGSGEEGFVYISFGSYASTANLPIETQQMFFDVLRSFPKVNFIWKWEGLRSKEMPGNVYTTEWAPQQAVLADKRIKGFITHGGLLSIEEATYYGVPLIVFPIFAEQDFNANNVERTGGGIQLEISRVSKVELQNAIHNLLTDPSFKNKMVETSKLFRDLPAKPLETAVWWTEYVLRHKQTPFLMPLAVNQTWYERRLLDVWGFITGVAVLILFLVYYIALTCLRIGRRGTGTGTPKRKDD